MMSINKEKKIFGLPVLNDNIIWIWVENKSVVVIDPAISQPVINFIEEEDLKLGLIIFIY